MRTILNTPDVRLAAVRGDNDGVDLLVGLSERGRAGWVQRTIHLEHDQARLLMRELKRLSE